MSNINLTAPLIDRDLTAPERHVISTSPTVLTMPVYWVTNVPDFVVTDTGDNLIFNDLVSATAYPLELTAPLVDRDLTAPERL